MSSENNVFLNHAESNARGTAILSKNVNFSVNSYQTDDDGRLQMLSVNLEGFSKKKVLINIYAPNVESTQVILLKNLNTLLEKFC